MNFKLKNVLSWNFQRSRNRRSSAPNIVTVLHFAFYPGVLSWKFYQRFSIKSKRLKSRHKRHFYAITYHKSTHMSFGIFSVLSHNQSLIAALDHNFGCNLRWSPSYTPQRDSFSSLNLHLNCQLEIKWWKISSFHSERCSVSL